MRKTNPQILEEIIMEEMNELRTPDSNSCICVRCQKEKGDCARRIVPRILKEFKRKGRVRAKK